MMDGNLIPQMELSSWVFAAIAIFGLGISKAGIKGIAIFHVTLMALAFGARESTGVLVPLLICGDIFAVIYYNRHARWKYIFKFLPWIILGVLIGTVIGKDMPEALFKWAMFVIILLSIAMMLWWDYRKSERVPSHWAFAGFIGILAGITTMIGNLAGAFSNIYFLAMRLPKNELIGTAAWLFFIVNLVKLPLHIFHWKTVTLNSLKADLILLPALILGIVVGVKLVGLIREKTYRKMILILTAVGAVFILFR